MVSNVKCHLAHSKIHLGSIGKKKVIIQFRKAHHLLLLSDVPSHLFDN